YFGTPAEEKQIGFARVITDFATYAYLADVFVLEEYRGQGLSKWLMQCIIEHPALQGFRRFTLATKDAHGLYAQFGFTPLQSPDRYMERFDPDVYQKKKQ
ncbi:MAG TPA: GNAT family N-acetyltransferase, partial [Candidatus Kapabacteria bacterium]|nr:GNAT family N-acetyltransferase [Candidatus Kapabacteria bacterium]